MLKRQQRSIALFGTVFVACLLAVVMAAVTREVYSNLSTATPSANIMLRAANAAGNAPCQIRTADQGVIQLPGAFQRPSGRVARHAQMVNAGAGGAESCVLSLHETDTARCDKASKFPNNRFNDAVVRDLRVVPSSSDVDGNQLQCLVSFLPRPQARHVLAYAAKVDPDAMNDTNLDLTRRLDDSQRQVAQLQVRYRQVPREPASTVSSQTIHFSMPRQHVHIVSITGFPSIQASAPGRNNYIITVSDGARVVVRQSLSVDNLSQLNIDVLVDSHMTRLSIMNNGVSNFVHPRFTAFTNAQLVNGVSVRAFT